MKYKRKITGFIVGIAYIILIGFLLFNVFSLSDKYSQEEMDMIVDIERDIKDALLTKEKDQIKAILDESRKNHGYDIVVTKEDEVVYKSVVFEPGDILVNRVHESAIAYESQGVFPADNDYWVWYSIYKLNDSIFINSFLTTLVILAVISTLLMALTVYIIYRTLFNPLKLIDQSLDLADQYQFDDIEADEDQINKKFKRFATDLQENISVVSRQHTDLERKLQSKRDLLNNTIVVSRSMVHDLKTPVHQNILENEIAEREAVSQDVIDITKRNQKLNQELMNEINTILRMLKSEETIDVQKNSNVEVVELITRSFKRFKVNISEKSLFVNIDAPEYVNITTDESSLTLLINNLLSNMVQYSKDHTELNISIEEGDNHVVLRFENESDYEDIARMKKTEQLFNVVQNPSDGKHVYSSGNGLYLIENLVDMLRGEYRLHTEDQHVIIEVTLLND